MFNLLFATISTLSFSIEFQNKFNVVLQNYFLFEGENQSAHLYRVNDTLTLLMVQGRNYSLLKSKVYVNDDSFTFSWPEFTINGQKMKKERNVGEISNHHYENYTFLSPLITFSDVKPVKNVYSIKDTFNYWYIVLIIFVMGIIFESKSHKELIKN